MKKTQVEWLYKSPQRLAREAQAAKSKIAKPKITGRKQSIEAKLSQQSTNAGNTKRTSRAELSPEQREAAATLAPSFKHFDKKTRARVWMPIVLDTLAKIPNYSVAAKAAGVCRETIINRRKSDPQFAEACEKAKEQGVETLEAHCWQRSTTGWKRPIFQRDEKGRPVQVGEETLYSDRLAEVLLRAHAPHKYSPKFQAELSGPGGAPLQPIVAPTQVIITIPDNGRDALPAIDVRSPSQPKQIADVPAPKLEAALAAPVVPEKVESAAPPAAVESDDERKARVEAEQLRPAQQ